MRWNKNWKKTVRYIELVNQDNLPMAKARISQSFLAEEIIAKQQIPFQVQKTGKARYSISTISAPFNQDEDEQMMLSLYQSTRRYFDCSIDGGHDNIDARRVISLQDFLSATNSKKVQAILQNFAKDIAQGWVIRFDDLTHYNYDMDFESKTLVINAHGKTFDAVKRSPILKNQILL